MLLLGDAVRFCGLYFITRNPFPQAHAAGPHQGNGAGQAMEVAYTLRRLSVMQIDDHDTGRVHPLCYAC